MNEHQKYPNLRENVESERDLEDHLEMLNWYQENAEQQQVTLPKYEEVDILVHPTYEEFLNPQLLYLRLESTFDFRKEFDGPEELSEDLSAAAVKIINVEGDWYPKDIAHQIAHSPASEITLGNFVKKYCDQFGLWYSVYGNDVEREVAQMHRALERLERVSHLPDEKFDSIVDEYSVL